MFLYFLSLFFLLLIAVLSFFAIFSIYFGLFFAAPWVPIGKKDLKRLFSLTSLKDGDVLYDLGSGDGRVIIKAVRDYRVKAVGFELSILLCLWAKLNIWLHGLNKQGKIKFKNFFKEDLGRADVIICFLMPEAMEKLRNKFGEELRTGTRIISYSFSIPGWQPVKIDKPTLKDMPIYLYQM